MKTELLVTVKARPSYLESRTRGVTMKVNPCGKVGKLVFILVAFYPFNFNLPFIFKIFPILSFSFLVQE